MPFSCTRIGVLYMAYTGIDIQFFMYFNTQAVFMTPLSLASEAGIIFQVQPKSKP